MLLRKKYTSVQEMLVSRCEEHSWKKLFFLQYRNFFWLKIFQCSSSSLSRTYLYFQTNLWYIKVYNLTYKISLYNSWFQTFAVIWIFYIFFWVFPRRQLVVGRRFGTLYQFHLQRLGEQFDAGEIPRRKYTTFSLQVISLILNLTRGVKRDGSVNEQRQGQSLLFQDHVLEF